MTPSSATMSRRFRFCRLSALLLLVAFPAAAQPAPEAAQPLPITLDEAVQIALVNNYTLRSTRLDVDNAEAQVREAWGQVYPQVNLSSSYTRNLKTPNPFAGSQAGGLFGSLGFVEWLAFNERARTDDDPSTEAISFSEFQRRRQEGLSAAGITPNEGANPFGVPNQFQNSLSVSQTLYSGSAFAAIKGAERLRLINERGADRQEQLLIDQVRQAYLQAVLAAQQAFVSEQSVLRTRATADEVSRRVAAGVAPKFQRLSAEVELANLETQLVQAQDQAALALDNLKLTMGVPVEQPITLRDALTPADLGRYLTASADDAVASALERRPDVEQARLAIELRQIDRSIARAQYLPTVSAFLNMGYSGNVPDDRSSVVGDDPDDPFSFRQQTTGFFSSSYWNPSVNVGLRLTWSLFDGFQTSARVQQRQIAVDKARIDYEQLVQSVRLEVERALRQLRTAQQRIQTQDQNVARAEENYTIVRTRLDEGVATQLELREASDQLDLSRFNYLQAVYDYLVARSAFETAVGMPIPAAERPIDLTHRDAGRP